MGVGVDQAGHDDATRCVHHPVNAFVWQVKPNGHDLFIGQQQIAAHFARWCYQCAVMD